MVHTSTHPHPHTYTLLLQAMNPGWGEHWKREAKPGLCYWPPSVYPPSFTPCACVRLPTLQNPYQASRPPKTIICQQSPPNLVLAKADCELIAPIWRIMQEKTRLSPDSVSQPTAANGCRSCDKSTLTSSKLIRRQADCWQLIILATPMSRGHGSSEGKEKSFPCFAFFFLSSCSPVLLLAFLRWTWSEPGYVIYIFHVFFHVFFFFFWEICYSAELRIVLQTLLQ